MLKVRGLSIEPRSTTICIDIIINACTCFSYFSRTVYVDIYSKLYFYKIINFFFVAQEQLVAFEASK